MLEYAPPHMRTFILMALYTGMRLSELLRCEWKHIDFEKGVIYVDKAKSKHYRIIPLNEALKAHLRDIRRKSGHVVARHDGKAFESREGAKKAFKNIIKRINEDPERIKKKLPKIDIPTGTLFHAFRHSCASWLIMSGADVYAVKEILGHQDLKTTQIYTHVTQDHLKRAMDKMSF